MKSNLNISKWETEFELEKNRFTIKYNKLTDSKDVQL